MTTDIDAAVLTRLDTSPVLRDPDRSVARLPGGLTNQNFVVDTAAGRFVARLSNPSGELLGIDRDAEHHNSQAAAVAGVAPEVVDYRPEGGLLVVRWVDAQTLTETDVREPATLLAIADACRSLHAGPRFAGDFDMFEIRRRYLVVVDRLQIRLPASYREFEPELERLEAVLRDGTATVPCHNDLLAANILDDGDRLWLIDYEYAGNNDPSFELGNIAAESHLDDDELVALTERYLGRADARFVARTRLQALMSQYGWTLWGVIQEAVSSLAFDFRGWAMEKYERAEATFTGPRLARDLRAAAGEDP